MSGTNAILAAIKDLKVSSNAHNNKPKDRRPPAPWRSKEEFEQMRRDGICVRCARPGHKYQKCPTYGPARRPKTDGVNALSGFPEEGNESESGNE